MCIRDRSESVTETKTGKLFRLFEISVFNEIVIFFLFSQDASYHAPYASEGTRNTMENKAKTDRIILICIRSDRGF